MNFLLKDGFAEFLYMLINKVSIDNTDSGLNFYSILFSISFSIILIFVLFKLWGRGVNYKHYNPSEYENKYKKLNGLLLIIIPIIFFDCFKNIFQFYSYGFLYYYKTQFFLTEIKDSFLRNWWEILIYFILFSGIYKVIFSFSNLIFFWGRKRMLKFLMLVYISSCVLIDGLKYFFVTQVIEPNHYIIYTVFNQWSESLYLSIVLILYFLFSRRVNAAFSK